MAAVTTLIVVGALLLLLETVLPGMVAGIVGCLCLGLGVFLTYARFGPGVGNFVLVGVVAGLVLLAVLWVRFFPESRMGRMFITRRTVGNLGVEKPELVNQTGTTLTILRPSGTAVINGQRVDVVTEGDWLEAGTPVKVIAVEGLRIVIRALQPAEKF
jgi:membrane-bound serine protease (ClpP class)